MLVLRTAQGVVVTWLARAGAVAVWVRLVDAEAAAPRRLFAHC